MPATSSAPGAYSQSASARGAKKVARRAVSTVAHQTAQAVTAGAGTAVSAPAVAHAASIGVAAPQAPSYEAALRQQRQVRKAKRVAKAQRQQARQIQHTLADSQKAQRHLTAKTAKLARQIERQVNTTVARPKVKVADVQGVQKQGQNLAVSKRLAHAILAEKPVAQAKLTAALAKLPDSASRSNQQKSQQTQKAYRRGAKTLPGLDASQTKVAAKVLTQGVKAGATKKELLAAAETGLVESNFQNLPGGDADSAGWRQERASLYPDPTNVKHSAQRYFSETASQGHGQGETAGELAANVQRPAAQYRGRYQEAKPQAKPIVEAFLADTKQYAALGKQQGSVPKQTVSRFQAIVDEAKKIDSAQLPYQLGAGHVSGKVPGPSKTLYDCSSAVSRVLEAAGYDTGGGAQVSGYYENFGKPGPGAVTIYANAEHVFMRIGNRYWGTSHANPNGGPGFIPTSYEQGEAQSGNYVVRHVPGLGQDIARRMGIRLTPGGTPGLSSSSSGTTATITDGVIRDTPGASSKPIKLDPKTLPKQRLKAQKQRARRQDGRQRSQFIRSLIAGPQTPVAPVATPENPDLAAALNRKVTISL